MDIKTFLENVQQPKPDDGETIQIWISLLLKAYDPLTHQKITSQGNSPPHIAPFSSALEGHWFISGTTEAAP